MSETIAFVAGATGFTGRAVVETLVERGASAVAHVRPDSSAKDEWHTRWSQLGATPDSTPWEPDALTERLRQLAPTVVFALLGTTRKRAKKEGRGAVEAYEAIDYGLTMMLYEAAVASGHRPRFVYLSSAGLSPDTQNPYLKVRARVEQALSDGPLPYTSARPSFIVGQRDESRPGEKIGSVVADGALGLLGALGARKLRDRYRSTDNVALARGLLRVALDPAFENAVAESEQLR